MTAGKLPVRDMGRIGKELGRLEAVLAKHAAATEKASEARDLEEARHREQRSNSQAQPSGCVNLSHSVCTAVPSSAAAVKAVESHCKYTLHESLQILIVVEAKGYVLYRLCVNRLSCSASDVKLKC